MYREASRSLKIEYNLIYYTFQEKLLVYKVTFIDPDGDPLKSVNPVYLEDDKVRDEHEAIFLATLQLSQHVEYTAVQNMRPEISYTDPEGNTRELRPVCTRPGKYRNFVEQIGQLDDTLKEGGSNYGSV